MIRFLLYKIKLFKYYFLYLILNSSGFVLAQSLQVQLIIPSGNDFQLYELWFANVIFNEPDSIVGFFEATITDENGDRVIQSRSRHIAIYNGVTVFDRSNYHILEPITISFRNPKFEDYIRQTNSLPPGNYEICISFYSWPGDIEVTRQCYNISSGLITPPYLISPSDGSQTFHSNPVFVWTPSGGTTPASEITYELKISEILGNQTPLASILNNPAHFIQENIKVSIYSYPFIAAPLIDNRKYSWQVRALLGNVVVAESDVWQFHYLRISALNTGNGESDSIENFNNIVAGKQFYYLKRHQNVSLYAPPNEMLYFIWKNPYSPEMPVFRITDESGNVLINEKFSTLQRNGLNFNELNLKNYSFFQDNNVYTIEFINKKNQKYSLRFLYSSRKQLE